MARLDIVMNDDELENYLDDVSRGVGRGYDDVCVCV